jgi:hypothetical protein
MFTFHQNHEATQNMNPHLKKTQQLTCLILIFTSILTAVYYLPTASAQMAIITVDPGSAKVGTQVSLTANLTTQTGTYELRFDTKLVANGTAANGYAVTNFTVPDAAQGTHNLIITDLTTKDNATKTFTVTTDYSISTTGPQTIREGDTIPILLNMTGGEASSTNAADVTVQAPTGTSYTKTVNITLSSSGNGTTTINYPTDFTTDANTTFVGTYATFFNTTYANTTFTVALTDATQYHRNQTVNIKAIYEPNENVTLTITGNTISNIVNLTDPTGTINYNWTVPATAAIGTYLVNIISTSGFTTKTPPDAQNFTVPGFPINFTTKNLAGEPVPYITIKATEGTKPAGETITSSTGTAALQLEIGNFTCTAYYNTINIVGQQTITVNDTTSTDLPCNLTNLRIQVTSQVNGAEMKIPETGILLQQDNRTFTTDINGTAIIHSLLPNTIYGLNLTRYGASFNITTIPNLLLNNTPVGWYDVKINCPTINLQITVTKTNGQTFNNAAVTAQELLGAPRYQGTTDANGVVTFNSVFGRYQIQIFDNNKIKLNETTIDLFQNQNVSVPCDLYGLTISVAVLDYFGQGIANINVKLQGGGQPVMTAKTQGDGTATFNNVIGGTLEVTLYTTDSSDPLAAQTYSVQDSTTLQLKIGKYVVLAGMLVEASQLVTIIIIILAVLLVLALEIYRRIHAKAVKGETESTDKES